ncbi:MAG: hypothetical protein U0V56_13225 [Actinomycetota bacterium]
MRIDPFEMERYQSLFWHRVEFDLSESGVRPMSIRELLGPLADAESFLATTKLGYPLSEGSEETRTNIAEWYPGATPEQVTVVNGGSEANLLTLWSLAGAGGPARVHAPQLPAGGPGSAARSASGSTRSGCGCATTVGRSTSRRWSAPWASARRS